MIREPKGLKKIIAGAGWLLMIAVPALVLSGCGTSGSAHNGSVRYGNPFYKHVRELPQNLAQHTDPQARPAEPDPEETGARSLARQGDALARRGNLAGAYVKYEQSLAKSPDNLNVQLKMARLLGRRGYSEDALKLLDGITGRQPDWAPAWEVMGMVYFFKKEYRRSRELFDKALCLDSKRWQAYAYLGLIHDLRKEHAEAVQAFETAIRHQPENGMLYNNKGASLAQAGRNLEAIAAFRQAVRRNYTPVRVFNNLGASLAALGRYAEAFEAFKKGGGEAQAHNNLGCMYLLAKQYEAAIRSFETAITITPHFYSIAYDNLRLAQIASGT